MVKHPGSVEVARGPSRRRGHGHRGELRRSLWEERPGETSTLEGVASGGGMTRGTIDAAERVSFERETGARTAAERWFREAVLLGNVDIAEQVFTPSVVMHSAAGDLVGLEAMKSVVLEARNLEGLEGRLTVTSSGEMLLARFVLRGRHSRPLCATAPTGDWLEIHGTVTIRSEGEHLAELWKTCTLRPFRSDSGAGATNLEVERPWAKRWNLTLREALVAELAMYGHGDKEIAARLELATTSVSKYLRGVLRKAGVASRSALAERAGVVRLG